MDKTKTDRARCFQGLSEALRTCGATNPTVRNHRELIVYLYKAAKSTALAVELPLCLQFYIIYRFTAFKPKSTAKPQFQGYS